MFLFLIQLIGGLALACYGSRFLLFLFKSVASTGSNSLRKYDAGKADVWAVVTGASGGIGKEFAVELAKRKFNVVLISRSAEKLAEVAKEVESKGVKSKVIAFDFSTPDYTQYTKVLGSELSKLDISILINNVGVNVDYPEYFADHTQADFESMLNTNVRSVHQMTHLLIDKFAQRKAAGIINVSSQSATMPSAPMLSVYAGTKAYLIAFSKALAVEYKSRKVDVLCITPSMVVSNMSKRGRASWDCPKPAAVVKPALNALGGSHTVISPYSMHAVMDFVMSIVPHSIIDDKVLALHRSTQKRAIEKRGQRKK